MRRTGVALLALLGLLPVTVIAAARTSSVSTGSEIESAISGNTIEGMLADTGAYAEFYSPDGYIHGRGYIGIWTVRGNDLCLEFEGTPESCWQASIDGDQVIWLRDGRAEGDGTILKGNPNRF